MNQKADEILNGKEYDEITIVVPIRAKTEYRQEIREKLLKLTELTIREDGNVCYNLHQADDDPDQFVIYEKWKNQTALDFHMNQEYLKNFLTESKTLLAVDIQGTICRQIS
jgi:quinol monooxygenase YgiN